jgi:CheY-like chemotaxis protein
MRRILVVDDDLHIRLAIRTWLKRCGTSVAVADGGPNGLAALDDATFDLMIVDIFMPNMRGFESIRIFHQRAPTVPLIAISGYAFSGPETENLVPEKWRSVLVRRDACASLSGRRRCSAYRRMPVGSPASSKMRCNTCRRRDRAVGTAGRNGAIRYFKGEDCRRLSWPQDVTVLFRRG